jgi:hypothetical protein
MKKKNCVYLGMLLFVALLGACKNNDKITDVIIPPDEPLFTSGQIVTSDLEKDGVAIESMIDTVVNLGSTDAPALFYLNGKHTINGVQVENGNQPSNAFRSISRQELHAFIKVWGSAFGLSIDLNDNSAKSVKDRQLAYFILQDFLRQNNVDLPLLVSLSNNKSNLKSCISLVDACRMATPDPQRINSPNTAGNMLLAIEASGIQPSDLSKAIQSKGLTNKEFVNMANQKGINFPATLKSGASTEGEIAEVVEAVFEGLVKLSKILVWFIEHGAPSVDIQDTYVSYLHQDDINPMNYIGSQTSTSPTYSVKYCTLATASFYLETEYNAVHKTLPGHFITRSGMIVKSVRCSGGMHVNGSTNFEIPTTTGTNDNPVSSTDGTVTVQYGDCCCFSRTATLTFTITGDKGYTETSWKPQVK